ncbi:hypothetical protein ACHQM5_011815 [Ranunculus cassubicifolius]
MEKKLIFTAIFSLLFIVSQARIPSNLIADEQKSLEETIPTTADLLHTIPTDDQKSQSTIAINDLQISTSDESTIRAIGIIHIHPINRHFKHHMMKHNCHHQQHGKYMIRNNPREVSYGNDMILSDGKGYQPFDRSQFFAKPFDQVRDHDEKYVGKVKIKKYKKKDGFFMKVSKFFDDLF